MLQAITIHFFCKAITKNHDFLFSATVNCYQGRVTVLTVMYVRGRESLCPKSHAVTVGTELDEA